MARYIRLAGLARGHRRRSSLANTQRSEDNIWVAAGDPISDDLWDGVCLSRICPSGITWAHNTGWYWHAYNSAGASNSNVWGIFQGPAPHFAGGQRSRNALVGMYGKPALERRLSTASIRT